MENEIEKVKLSGDSSKFILIPYDVVLDTTMNKYRALVYSYLYLKTAMDNTLTFNTENFKKWSGKQIGVNRKLDTYADKIILALSMLNNKWFVSFDSIIKKGHYTDIVFDKDRVYDYCSENRFAVIYLDELNTILSYNSNNPRDTKFDNSILLLVFLYLRANIPIRHNNYCDNAEAYDTYYKTIGQELGLSEKVVSKAASILMNMGLIYIRVRNPIKYFDKKDNEYKFKTPTNIFCNTYKRVKIKTDIYLEAEGYDYYLVEVENKIKYLEKFNI